MHLLPFFLFRTCVIVFLSLLTFIVPFFFFTHSWSPTGGKACFFFFKYPFEKKKKRGVLSLSIVEVHFQRALFVFLCVFFFFRLRAAGFKRARECELFYQSWVSRASVRVLKRHLYCHVRLSVSPFFFLFVFLLFLKSFFFSRFYLLVFFFYHQRFAQLWWGTCTSSLYRTQPKKKKRTPFFFFLLY